MTASAHPSSGPAPGGFQVDVQGGTPPYSLAPLPSPPNPDPMPDHTISGLNVGITGTAPEDTVLYFQVTDAMGQTATVTYTVTGR